MGKVRFPEAPTSFPLPTKSRQSLGFFHATRTPPQAHSPFLPPTSQGNKTLAPGDAHRREQRKKEIAKNKAKRKEARDDALKSADVGTRRAAVEAGAA